MKICFISFEYPPFIIGGAGVYAAHITTALAKLGHEIHVISPSIREQETHQVENEVLVHRIPIVHKNFLRAPSFWFRLIARYNTICNSAGGFDIVHGNAVSDFSLSKWLAKVPRVITVHHLSRLAAQRISIFRRILDFSGETGLTPIIERATVLRAGRLIAVSSFTKKTLISAYGIHPSKIDVIQHGMDPNDHAFTEQDTIKFRESIGLHDDNIAFLFVGRLNDPRKNLPFLINAFKVLSITRGKSPRLLLIGAGDQIKLRKSLQELGIEGSVIVLGYVDEETLRRCYHACDVFASPSLLEGFGLTLLEAMAAREPIIALNVGANSELVKSGVNGLLVSEHDPRELTTAMAFFMEHPYTVAKIGRLNRNHVLKNFTWQKSAKLTEQVYRSVLDHLQ